MAAALPHTVFQGFQHALLPLRPPRLDLPTPPHLMPHTPPKGAPTVEPLTGAQALCGHPHLHGAADVACLLAPVGQEGQELLGCAANHRLERHDALP